MAISLFVLCMVMTGATLWMQVAALSVPVPEGFGSGAANLIERVTSLLFPLVGTLIAVRRPSNSIGWLILGATTVHTFDSFMGEYALRGLVIAPGSLPGAGLGSWIYQWAWIIPLSLLPVLFVLFPTGRARGRLDRWFLAPSWAAALLVMGPVAVLSWPYGGRALLLEADSIPELKTANTLLPFALGLFLLGLILSVVSLLVRWRKSSGVERLQIRWLLSAGFVLFVDFFFHVFVDIEGLWRQLLSVAALMAVPLAIGIAILRYRLYEIDRIISRTLAYGVLTMILAGGYLLAVLALQSVLPVDDGSPLIVAASTLAVVAAFGPLRGRVQRAVDSRFNRARYDSERIIAEFGDHLRSEVELNSLADGLLGVVHSTMQPTHLSLWLRPTKDLS
ncbi:MAG: hypothetical protein ACRDK3_02270 [Actinomycetota bacterium]